MAATFSKPFLPLPDQIALLESRGLVIADKQAAQECLHRNSYYRLSAYWYPFRVIGPLQDSSGNPILDSHGNPVIGRTNTFLPDSTFEDARRLYVFDKEFKLLLMDAIERVEIAVRTEIALCLGQHDVFAHTQESFFRPDWRIDPRNPTRPSKHQKWLDTFATAVNRSRDEFIVHYENKYGSRSPLPIWIAIELWDFGRLSFCYSGLDTPYRVSVATRFSIAHRDLLKSWLVSLNFVRNVIAHHGRLWNLNLADYPALPRRGLMPDFDVLHSVPQVQYRIYSVCCILSYFSKIINPQSSWPQKLAAHVRDFPAMPYASIQDMGFPADWETHPFWL
jgi:abortive infection bacteriophage resistance protein